MVQKYTFWGKAKVFLKKVEKFFEILFLIYVSIPLKPFTGNIFSLFYTPR